MSRAVFPLAALAVLLGHGLAQQPTPATPAPPAPHGDVLFERHTDEAAQAATQPATSASATTPQASGPEFTDADRTAIAITDYDLDAQIVPAKSQLAVRARLMLRNDAGKPQTRIALQISSTLTWESVSVVGVNGAHTRLELAQHSLETDADHTGAATEAIVTLPAPLAPGATLQLDTFYSGTITASGGRLERIGATPVQAATADWDSIEPTGTALRGFGSVLWYPVAAPQLFLGDGAKLFQAIGEQRLRNQSVSIHLRLFVEYRGESPVAAYFCGRRQPLIAISDSADAPVLLGSGVATAEFARESLGFRQPSLFLLAQRETPLDDGLLAVETTDEAALPRLGDAAKSVNPLLERWFGPHPLSALTILDHNGQPFEDGPLLVGPVATLAASTSSTALVHSLTHAYVQTGQPWFDEGLAQFASLIWDEQQQGRDTATRELTELMRPVTLAEPPPDLLATASGQPLIAATDELYYRRKAAAVWWMLRSLVGDQPLSQALTAWRVQPVSHDSAEAQAVGFEHLLEKVSGKDLGWFFSDWVLRDRGMPDLTIVDVTPRQLPAGQGHDSGWLVAVTVRNEGGAAAEVPLIIRSGTFSTTRSLHIAGLSNVTERFLVESQPSEVVLNDGTVPEVRVSTHTRQLQERNLP
jgi:hypothetical protein